MAKRSVSWSLSDPDGFGNFLAAGRGETFREGLGFCPDKGLVSSWSFWSRVLDVSSAGQSAGSIWFQDPCWDFPTRAARIFSSSSMSLSGLWFREFGHHSSG